MQDDPEDVLTTGWVGTWDLRKGRESMRETTQMNEPGSNFWYFFFTVALYFTVMRCERKVILSMVLAVCVPVLYLLIPDLFYGKATWYESLTQVFRAVSWRALKLGVVGF